MPSFLKDLRDCPDGCGAYGTVNPRTDRVKGCKNAARRQGLANKRNGAQAQGRARKSLGVPGAHTRSKLGNEENWRHPWFRFEVKSGKQVEPIWTRFAAAEAQADEAKAVGDPRPFVMAAMPDGLSIDGLVVMRLETWRTQIVPLLEESVDGSAVLKIERVNKENA